MPRLLRAGRVAVALLLSAFLTLASPAPSAPSLLDQAALSYKKGRYQESVELLKSLPYAESTDPRALTLLGLGLRRLQRDREAIAPLKRAAQLNPQSLDAPLNLGLCYYSEGQWAEARRAFEAAAKAAPSRPEPWMALGLLEATGRDWEKSRLAYAKALELDSRQSGAWLALSDTLIELGRTREAAEARERAGALLKGKDSDLHFKQAALWYGLGEIEKALKDFDASDAGSQPEALFLRGCLSYRMAELDKAAEYFRAALEARHEYPEAQLNLGITHFAQEDFAAAMDDFRRADSPEYLRAAREAAVERFLRQGSLAVLEQDFPRALESWEKARALGEDPATIQRMIDSLRKEQAPQAGALAGRGDAAMQEGRLAEALELWNQALEIDPKNAAARAGLKKAEGQLDALKEAAAQSAAAAAAKGDFRHARQAVQYLQSLDAKAGKAAAESLKKSLDLEIRRLVDESAAALKAERYNESLALLDSCIALDSGRMLLLAKRKDARTAQRKAVSERLALAGRLEAEGKPSEAMKAAEEALMIDGEDLEALRMTERLAASLNISRAGAASVRRWYYEGVYAYGAGRTQDALGIWLKAQKAAPGDRQLAAAIRTARTKLKSLEALEKKKP